MRARELVSDEELHAYLDGGLDPARRLDVAVYLAGHPIDAARAEAFRAQREGIRALFDHVLDQPAPDKLRRLLLRHASRTLIRGCCFALAAASLAVFLFVGGRALSDHLSNLNNPPAIKSLDLQKPQSPTGTVYPVIPPPPVPRSRRGADI